MMIRGCLIFFIGLIVSERTDAVEACCIKVVDESNGWPVPLVELKTTHQVRFVSDNAGLIAFDLPELMGTETWFEVIGHGYVVPKDGFGNAGVRLIPRPGETHVVKVRRLLPAKRIGRITGGGLFAESQKLGREQDWRESRILGCDSVQNVVHDGKLFWNWGDTTLPGYPLGLFHMTGATTRVQPLSRFEPPIRLEYDYFKDEKGVPRNIAQMPGAGPTWLSGLASVPDQHGVAQLVATYTKVKPPMDAYECGLCVWNERLKVFEKSQVIWARSDESPKPILCPQGHPVLWNDAKGKQWLLFGDPFPSLKCPASFEAWSNPTTWQALEAQKTVQVYQAKKELNPHRGAIAWSRYRKKWITVFTQMGGDSSLLGELWYAESELPTGTWCDAIHVVTHSNYTFYNPQIHVEFTGPDSPILLFEATYTKEFSGATPTPRHDYNQVLYRLDLDQIDLP